MNSQLPDTTRTGPFEPRRNGGGRSWIAPLVVALSSFGIAAALGFERLEHVLASGPRTVEEWLLLATIAVGMLATLALSARVARPKVDEPLGHAPAMPQSSGPITSSSSPTAPSMPTPSPVPSNAEDRASLVRRARWIMIAIATLAPVVVVGVTAYSVTKQSSSKISEISTGIDTGEDPACPRPDDGVDALDAERTDCLPLDGEDAFELGPTSIQGEDYVALAHDDADDCSQVLDQLRSTTCSQVARGLYETADQRFTGAVSILAFATEADAERIGPTLDARAISLPPEGAARDRWSGPDARGACIPSVGRYVTCLHVAPDASASPEEATVVARHLNFVATDVLVARRFELL